MAGVANAVIVLGQGIMLYDETTDDFVPLDTDTRSYIDSKIDAVLGGVSVDFGHPSRDC